MGLIMRIYALPPVYQFTILMLVGPDPPPSCPTRLWVKLTKGRFEATVTEILVTGCFSGSGGPPPTASDSAMFGATTSGEIEAQLGLVLTTSH